MLFEKIYDEDGITLYHGDAREIVPFLAADALITDPVWPNCEHVFPGIDARQLLADTLVQAQVKTIVIHLGVRSDPRFLEAVPPRYPFIRSCLLEYSQPSYQGRVLNNGDTAYVFGEPPPAAKGRHLLPGRFMSGKIDRGLTRWNWDSTANRRRDTGEHVATMPHPTPRRLAHVEWLVSWFGQSSVIDPFVGSGSTMLACKRLGKRGIGIDIERDYLDFAIERLRQRVLPLWEEGAA